MCWTSFRTATRSSRWKSPRKRATPTRLTRSRSPDRSPPAGEAQGEPLVHLVEGIVELLGIAWLRRAFDGNHPIFLDQEVVDDFPGALPRRGRFLLAPIRQPPFYFELGEGAQVAQLDAFPALVQIVELESLEPADLCRLVLQVLVERLGDSKIAFEVGIAF